MASRHNVLSKQAFGYRLRTLSLLLLQQVSHQEKENQGMSFWLIVAVAVIYFGIALDNLRQQDYPHALIWAAYAVANIGFVWYELTKGK